MGPCRPPPDAAEQVQTLSQCVASLLCVLAEDNKQQYQRKLIINLLSTYLNKLRKCSQNVGEDGTMWLCQINEINET